MVEYDGVRYLGCTGCAHARYAYYGQLPRAQHMLLLELCCWIKPAGIFYPLLYERLREYDVR